MTPDEAAAALGRIDAQFDEAVKLGINQGMRWAQRYAIEQRMAGGGSRFVSFGSRKYRMAADPPNPPPGPIKRRSGSFARAVDIIKAEGSGDTYTAGLKVDKSKFPGAAVHEFGATITPRTGKYLVFPVPDASQANGARLVFAKSVTIRARPVVRPALFAAIPEVQSLILARVEEMTLRNLEG